ncbi:MAG: phytoene desaturase family protein [Bacteroidota bacterium]|nr:phytoene desaturase family protein [Bacteroidota bacterium]
MKQSQTVAIIGAGIGGITASIFLAQKGYKVKVFEKNSSPGGRCGQTMREGHRFDIGATIYFLPSIYEQVFSKMGLDVKECFDFLPMKTLYKLYFDDDSQLNFSHDPEVLREQLETREPGSYQMAMRYAKKGYKFLEIGLRKLLDRNFYHPFQFITLNNLLQIIRIKGHLKHSFYIRRFFKHPHHRMAFTFQNIYVGQSPYNSSALFSMLPAAEIIEGSMFPKGGMHNIVEKMIEIGQDLGVEFSYDKPVTRIITENRQAKKLLFEDGSDYQSDLIIANADLPYVYRELLPPSWQGNRINRHQFTCSAIVFHWGIDKVYPQLSHHNVFLVDDYKNSLDTVFKKHSLGEKPCFYIHAPTRTDETAAPAKQDTLSVIIPAPHLDDRHSLDWQHIKKMAREGVIDRLKKLGINDLEEHIKFEVCCMPDTWDSYVNVSKGATFGSLSHRIFQMGYFRPHNRHRKYRNLYFTGGSTHPGNGIPLVLLSGKLTSERILHDFPNH